jgi:hypothetical protein
LFGDKGEAIAGQVVAAAQAVTGTSDPEAAKAALAANPDLLAKLQMQLATLNADLERAYLADRQSARSRDVALAQAGQHNWRADLMVLSVTVGLIACVGVLAIFRQQVPGEVVGILSTVAGIFGACLKDAFGYEFGSSRGSREKGAMLAATSAKSAE